ncbi:OPT/YSL family transporter [Cystobacter fuscus]|uniref:OPT/YSL family transporter n=1 Tax=Cystobacter fuscus TaxID=43 RepID=UPI002B2DB4FA|nr:OPT family oligopeptide transporter [Cystobacter fuscus]
MSERQADLAREQASRPSLDSPRPPFQTIAPEPSAPVEWTPRAWLVGSGIGAMLAVTNVYMGLKTGFWESGCLMSALLAFGGLSLLSRRGAPLSPLETNLAQTTAVSVGATPASAGLIGAVPALALLGTQPPGWAVAAWGVGLGALGVLFAYLSRRRLLEEEALPFPTGVATSQLISTLHSTGSAYAARARGLWVSGVVSAALTWLRDARGVIPGASLLPASVRLGGVGADSLMLGVGWMPMLLGIGVLAGPHAGLSLLLGSALAWGGVAPWLVHSGMAAAEYGELSSWLLWPGVGLMVGASATSLLSQLRALPAMVGDVRALGAHREGWESAVGRGVGRAVLPVILLCLLAGTWAFGLGPLELLLALGVTFPLCAVCARATGQSDIAPISHVGQLTQVGFGVVAPGREGLNIAAGTVVSGAASHTSASLWSLQAGRLLGASASRQFLAQLSGLLWGVAVAVPTYFVLVSVYGLESNVLPVPTARQFKAVAQLTSQGLAGLPPGSALAMGGAFVVGGLLSVAGSRERWARVLPSAAAMAIGLFVPAYYAVTICLGSLLVSAVGRLRPSALQPVQAMGTGAILGETLLGVLVAVLIASGLIPPPG